MHVPPRTLARFSTRNKLILLLLLGIAGYVGYDIWRKNQSIGSDQQTVRAIVASEELILNLTPRLKDLSRSLMNLNLPDAGSYDLFKDQIQTVGLAAIDEPGNQETPAHLSAIRSWTISEDSKIIDTRDGELFQPLLKQTEYFEHAKFFFISGHFTDEEFTEFESTIGFHALTRTTSGGWRGIDANQIVVWHRSILDSSEEPSDWRISEWRLISFHSTESQQKLFSEVLAQALPRTEDYVNARRSEHFDQVLDFYRRGEIDPPYEYFAPLSANLKPGLAVVDIDNDGFDDLYVMVRSGENQFLRNRGDGTFEEIAEKLGLAIDGHSTCAVFADFDNDGDSDLMLGRSLAASMYLENVGGRFVKRPYVMGKKTLPYLVVSMSAADYNGDGLLDVYLCTYRPAMLEDIVGGAQGGQASEDEDEAEEDHANADPTLQDQQKLWPERFLPEDQASDYYRRSKQDENASSHYQSVLNQFGPPNVLLVNRGRNRFEVSPETKLLGLWRNSLQASWSDFDEDGDPDLYISNDWAEDNFFRNDGSDGFKEITKEAGFDGFGFAMGASWGDYDNDGVFDLYVSNMYSKAGRRITSQIDKLDPKYALSASGNFLYRGRRGQFDLVSGLKPPAMTVSKAGWAWGGQFLDVDNDGFLDLYVASGYFSAPKQFASQVDL